jgi:PPOX class probable FMN-dependent enzyme
LINRGAATRPATGAFMTDPHRIRSESELREIIAEPNAMIQQKFFDHVDPFAGEFIRRAPLVFISTVDAEGTVDVSPKGDAPGFVVIEDSKTLLIPERPGNKLACGFRNILANPKVGIIFVVPGVTETLRIRGSAELTRDPEILQRLEAKNKPAILATRIHVEASFFHCGKALIRSKLWKADSWPEGVKANIGKQIAARSNAGDEFASALEKGLDENYENELY